MIDATRWGIQPIVRPYDKKKRESNGVCKKRGEKLGYDRETQPGSFRDL